MERGERREAKDGRKVRIALHWRAAAGRYSKATSVVGATGSDLKVLTLSGPGFPCWKPGMLMDFMRVHILPGAGVL